MPEFVTTTLRAMASKMMEQEPSQVLGMADDTYLERWYLHRDRERGNVYLHRTLRSDRDEELHDHPFDNVSLVLDEMDEELPGGIVRTLAPGSIVVRKAADRHRLIIREPARSLFLTGPKIREWGFWGSDGSFLHNQDFFKLRGYF